MCFSGVFALLNAYAFLKYIQSFLTKAEFKAFFVLAAAAAAGVIFLAVVGLTWAGRTLELNNNESEGVWIHLFWFAAIFTCETVAASYYFWFALH